MQALLGNNRDFYGGLLVILIGALALWGGLRYDVGSLADMGPGFFPAAIGGLLILVGAIIAFSGLGTVETTGGIALPDLRGLVCITLGLIAFAAFGVYGGLVPATFALVFVAALGDRKNTLQQAVWLSLAMVAIAIVVFRWALQLQLPLVTWG